MRFEVLLTAGAQDYLDEIVEFIAAHDSAGNAALPARIDFGGARTRQGLLAGAMCIVIDTQTDRTSSRYLTIEK